MPVVEIITATESACRNLNISDANELRAKIVNVLCKHRTRYQTGMSRGKKAKELTI